MKTSSVGVVPPRLACAWYAECRIMSSIAKTVVPQWRAFGVLAGNWDEGFDNQGDNANLWSRSAFPDNVDNADNANFNETEVNPADNNNRNAGFAVR